MYPCKGEGESGQAASNDNAEEAQHAPRPAVLRTAPAQKSSASCEALLKLRPGPIGDRTGELQALPVALAVARHASSKRLAPEAFCISGPLAPPAEYKSAPSLHGACVAGGGEKGREGGGGRGERRGGAGGASGSTTVGPINS